MPFTKTGSGTGLGIVEVEPVEDGSYDNERLKTAIASVEPGGKAKLKDGVYKIKGVKPTKR